MPTPKISGYKATKRIDRKGGLQGGGLITYVKETVVFEGGGDSSQKATDVTTTRVQLNRKNWISVSNIYCPPVNSTGQEIAFTPESIPTPDNAIITGDLNGHAPLWDLIQPTDKRGEDIVEWALDKELTILNDCSTTRVSRITGNESTPDVTLMGRKWDGKCTWEVCEQIGSSDHLPIKITVNSKITHQPIFGKAARWKRNGVNWNDYSAAVEESVTTMPEEPNITKRILRFNQIIN